MGPLSVRLFATVVAIWCIFAPVAALKAKILDYVPFSNSTAVYSTNYLFSYDAISLYIAEDGDIMLIKSSNYVATTITVLWKTWLPPALRGGAYQVLDVDYTNLARILVAQGSRVFRILCSSTGCITTGGVKQLPLPLTDEIEAIHLIDRYNAEWLLLVTPHRAVAFDAQVWHVDGSVIDWSQYETQFNFTMITSTTWLRHPHELLLISLGTTTQPEGVGAIVSLKQHLTFFKFTTITFFSETPGNMIESSVPDPNAMLYWAQSKPGEGRVWEWPSKKVGTKVFSNRNDVWSSRLCPTQQYDGSMLLASGNPSSHTGFDFWVMQNLYFGTPLNVVSPDRGWALPNLSQPASASGLHAASKTKFGSYDIVLISWSFFTTQESETLSIDNFSHATRSDTLDSHSNTAQSSDDSTGTHTRIRRDNCRSSNCDINDPGDCEVSKCWGFGDTGEMMCCKYPPSM